MMGKEDHVKRRSTIHPLRGGLFGMELGGAIVVLLILYGKWDYSSFAPGIVVVVALGVLGSLWGVFGPPRRAKSKAPAPEG